MLRLQALKALFLLGGYQALKVVKPKSAPKVADKIPAQSLVAGIDRVDTTTQDPAVHSLEISPALDEQQDVAQESEMNFFPHVEWTNEERSPQLAGRAAEYNETSNIALANRDFKGFTDLIQFFTSKYADNANVAALIVSAVNEGVEQALMECIAGALSLRTQPHWSAHHIHLALTPEALTTALMQRYWMASYVDQVIRQELAKVRAESA